METFKSFFGIDSGGTTWSDLNEENLFIIRKKNYHDNIILVLDGSKDQCISGVATVRAPKGKQLNYQRIIVECLGYFLITIDGKTTKKYFLSEKLSLGYDNTIYGLSEYDFGFKSLTFPYESYNGTLLSIKYCIQVTIERTYGKNISNQHFFEVQHPFPITKLSSMLVTTIGIEDAFSVIVNLDKTIFTCNDILTGSLVLSSSFIHIKQIMLSLTKKEYYFKNKSKITNTYVTDIYNHEILDGNIPVGTTIPFRLFFKEILNLYPAYGYIDKRFSLEWYLKLTIETRKGHVYIHHIPIDICRGLFNS